MVDVNGLYSSSLCLDRIAVKFGINPRLHENKSIIAQLLSFGKLSA